MVNQAHGRTDSAEIDPSVKSIATGCMTLCWDVQSRAACGVVSACTVTVVIGTGTQLYHLQAIVIKTDTLTLLPPEI